MIQFDCPKCGRHLKVADELAGRKGKCPGCAASLLIPAALAGVSARPQMRVRPAANGAAHDANPKLKLRPVADKYDRADDADDKRDSREPVPAFKPKKKKRKKKQASKAGLWLAITGLAILFLAGVGVGAYFAFFRNSNEQVPSNDDSNKAAKSITDADLRDIFKKYLPDDTVSVSFFNGDRFAESPYVKDSQLKEVALSAAKEFMPSTGVKPLDQMKTVLKAVNDKNQAIYYEVANSKWAASTSGNKIEIGGRTVYDTGMKSTCLIDEYTRLSGDTPLVKKVLERTGDAKLNAELKAMLDKTDFLKKTATMVAVGTIPSAPVGRGPSASPGINLGQASAASQWLKVDADMASDVSVDIVAQGKDASAVQAIRTEFEKAKSQMKSEINTAKALLQLATQQGGASPDQTKAINSMRESLEIFSQAIESANVQVADGKVTLSFSMNAEKARKFAQGMAEGQRLAKENGGGGRPGPGGPGGGPIGPGGPGGGPIGPGGPGGGPIGPGGPGGGPIGPGGPGGGPIGPGGPGGGPIGPGGPGGGPIGPGGPGGGPIGPGGPGGGPTIGPGGPGGGPIGPGGPGGGPIGPGGPGGGPIGPGGPGGGIRPPGGSGIR